MSDLLAVVGGYVLGSMPFGYWVPRLIRGEDIRTKGSGNVGASNVFRVYGRSLGVPVALLDLAKGFAAAALGLWAGGALIGVLAGAAAMIGHARPVFLGFQKGGKMVATAGGALLALAPLAAFICIGIWLVTFLLTRYASLASIVTALALVVLCPGSRLSVADRGLRDCRRVGGDLPPPRATFVGSSREPSTASSCARSWPSG